MPRLTKTQARLMADVAREGIAYVQTVRGRGARGGQMSGGQRAINAAFDLVTAGLLVLARHSDHAHVSGGYTIRTTDYVFTPPSPKA